MIAVGSRLLTVTLYSDANGNNKLWQSTMNTTVDASGVFNLLLGTPDNPLPAPSAMDRPIWLGVAVDNGPELRPLSEVTASAYALNVVDNAITTAKLANNSVTTPKIADSSVTASKVNMDYISSININGVQFTGHGTPLNIQGENGITAAYIGDSNTLVLSGPNSNQNAPIANGDLGTDWSETGNHQISIPTQYLGTSDTSTGMELHLKNDRGGDLVRVAHFQYDNNGSPNITMGYGSGSLTGNIIGNAYNGTAYGSTIAGGGDTNNVNSINSSFSFIGSGTSNTLTAGSDYSVIGSGSSNRIVNSTASVIAGGGANKVDTSAYSFLGGGATNIIRPYAYEAVIGGGLHNIIDTFSNYSFIGGGDTNYITNSTQWGKNGHYANNATIAGGSHNTVLDYGAFICGGDDNLAGEEESAVVAGLNDTSLAPQSTIAGGYRNRIGVNNVEYVWQSFIGGGASNEIDAEESVIGGGLSDTIVEGAPYSVIGGGRQNLIQGPWSVIAGGDSNDIFNIEADHNVIGGGLKNVEQNPSYGVIAGGAYNLLDTAAWGSGILGGVYDTIFAQLGVIGGGRYNTIDNISDYGAAIGGGELNHINANLAFLGGGQYDKIDSNADNSGLLGGGDNTIQAISSSFSFNSPGGTIFGFFDPGYEVLAGGQQDTVRSTLATLGGGYDNILDTNSVLSVLAGGDQNLIRSPFAFIGGGYTNTIAGAAGDVIVGGGNNDIGGGATFGTVETKDFIGGGESNHIGIACWSVLAGGYQNKIFSLATTPNGNTANYDFLGGGQGNAIDSSEHASLSGGNNNIITFGGQMATIPGGDSLIAQSYGQTVMGYFNIASGSFTKGTGHAHTGTTQDQPLVIVGNGEGGGGATPRCCHHLLRRSHFCIRSEWNGGGCRRKSFLYRHSRDTERERVLLCNLHCDRWECFQNLRSR